MAKIPTCPDCGGHAFELTVLQFVDVEFMPGDPEDEDDFEHEVTDGPRGDMEWSEDTEAICCEIDCGWSGRLGDTAI